MSMWSEPDRIVRIFPYGDVQPLQVELLPSWTEFFGINKFKKEGRHMTFSTFKATTQDIETSVSNK